MEATNNLNNITSNGNDGLLPKNNTNLYDQIKLCIISDYFPNMLSKMAEGTMEFFIRDGELAIHYLETEIEMGAAQKPSTTDGLKRSHLLTFLMMIEHEITALPVIEYGTIIIQYRMEDGTIKAKMKYRQQVNHRRR